MKSIIFFFYSITTAFFITNLQIVIATTETDRRLEYDAIDVCLEKQKELYPEPLWFVSEAFKEDEILARCSAKIESVMGDKDEPSTDTLRIECDWTQGEDEALRGKGLAYELVEEACNEKGGLMYTAHSLKTVLTYATDLTEVTETSQHYNVPVCLDPGCDPEEFLLQEIPCSQFDLFPFTNAWEFEKPDTSYVCVTHSIVAATYMDDECETKLTYNFLPENGDTCIGDFLDPIYICDFFEYSNEEGDEYLPDICGDDNEYKYSYGLKGIFVDGKGEVPVLADHYYLNHPTCLKEGCDVKTYFMKNLIPYHSTTWFKEERDNESIFSTTGVGIFPVGKEEEMTGKSSKGTKSPKGTKIPKGTKGPKMKTKKTKAPKRILR